MGVTTLESGLGCGGYVLHYKKLPAVKEQLIKSSIHFILSSV